jgi:phospholipid/cholesterol/gamma-HCH transport system substrate-binding protein
MEYYKDKKSTETKVGIFVIAALIILVSGYFWFSDFIQNRKYTHLQVRFANAGNLEKGSSVSILGVERGKVKKLSVDETGVILDVAVILDFPLPEDTKFSIMETDMMGGAQVDLSPGKSKKLLDLNVIQSGQRSGGISTLVSQLSDVIMDLKKVMKPLTGDDNLLYSLTKTAESSAKIAEKMNSSIDENSQKMHTVIENISQISSQIITMIDENKNSMTSAVSNISKILEKADEDLEKFRLISDNVYEITEKIQNEDSSFNKLVSERELYDDLLKTTASMDSLLKDIKKHPKRYFKIEIF